MRRIQIALVTLAAATTLAACSTSTDITAPDFDNAAESDYVSRTMTLLGALAAIDNLDATPSSSESLGTTSCDAGGTIEIRLVSRGRDSAAVDVVPRACRQLIFAGNSPVGADFVMESGSLRAIARVTQRAPNGSILSYSGSVKGEIVFRSSRRCVIDVTLPGAPTTGMQGTLLPMTGTICGEPVN
jgi:hypothetical protein